jgi:hypothetical protein
VVFITNDKSFFSQRDPDKGIDPVILLEISKNKLNLNIIYGDNFNNFISKFEKDIPPIPKKEITSELNLLIQKEILKHIKNQGITELKKEEITLNSFHTRNKNILLITFSGNFKLFHEDDSAENRNFNSGLISVKGSINYNFDENKLHSFKINTRNLTWPSHTNRKSIHTGLINLKTDLLPTAYNYALPLRCGICSANPCSVYDTFLFCHSLAYASYVPVPNAFPRLRVEERR